MLINIIILFILIDIIIKNPFFVFEFIWNKSFIYD